MVGLLPRKMCRWLHLFASSFKIWKQSCLLF